MVKNQYLGHCYDDPVVIKDANSPASEELLVFCREKVIQDNFNELEYIKYSLSVKKLKSFMEEDLPHMLHSTK